MSMTKEFEDLARNAYLQFGKLAKIYDYRFLRTTVTRGGAPCMLFLGNHSSGKSSLINWLLGGDAVQDVGLAPTDDGFTMLIYGEKESDVCGSAAIAYLPEEFGALNNFGSNFLQHLRVKVRNRPLLKSVILIDSPGMIDTAEHTVSRTYDFEGVVRLLAELCDMVFFMLDPDKPGTTGETVNIFSKCLGGMDSKVRVLFNKCDSFNSLYDFARTYGTVCWNLARVLQTKDLPKIWTIYSGEERKPTETGMALTDFNRHRCEFLNTIKDSSARRRDNVFAQVQHDFIGLSVRMRIVNRFARAFVGRVSLVALAGATLVLGCYFSISLMLPKFFGTGSALAQFLGGFAGVVALVGTGLFAGRYMRFVRCQYAQRVDQMFEDEYKSEIMVGMHDDLRKIWKDIRDETAEIISKVPLGKWPFFGEFHRWRLDVAAQTVFAAFKRE